MPLKLSTLGGLDLHQLSDGDRVERVELPGPKISGLFLYLAIEGQRAPVRRSTLCRLFWSDADAASSRNSLRSALCSLRRALPHVVSATGSPEEIGIRPDGLWCDAHAFDRAASNGRWREAMDLYRGAFLRGFHVAEALDFEQWLDRKRERLAKEACSAAWHLAEDAVRSGETVEAALWARQSVKLAPYDELNLRRALEFLDELGDRAGAIHVFEQFRDRLRAEFDGSTSPRTLELVEEIRSGQLVSTRH